MSRSTARASTDRTIFKSCSIAYGDVRGGGALASADADAEGLPARARGDGVHGAVGCVDGGLGSLEHASTDKSRVPIASAFFMRATIERNTRSVRAS